MQLLILMVTLLELMYVKWVENEKGRLMLENVPKEIVKKAKIQLAIEEAIKKVGTLDDVTKHILKHGVKRLIIVEFTKRKDTKYYNFHKYLSFLVDDVSDAQCPGYPACGVEYFDSFEEGKTKIEKLYKRIGYTPRYSIDKYVSRKELI